MDTQSASRTAMAAAIMRARHTRRDPNCLINDAWGDRLVPAAAHAAVHSRALAELQGSDDGGGARSPDLLIDEYLRRLPAYTNVILRSRYAEDALERTVAGGALQYVLIGAGFDSFFLRRPPFARDIAIYEVDHPATQQLKRRRLAECGITAVPGVHFVAADLGAESIASALARSSFRSDLPSFFSWLGVTMYLTRDANLETLRAIARCSAAGSGLVFTYLDERMLDPDSHSDAFRALKTTVASMNEPFISGFNPAELNNELREAGLELVEDLNGPELVQRYDRDGVNGFQSTVGSRIAWARVEAPAVRA